LEGRDVPTTFAPTQLVHAYGFDQIRFAGGTLPGDGRGQTIALVDAFDDPNIAADLQTFNTRYGLNNPLFTFTKATPFGTPPANANWAMEMALDVEWAHAIAPAANLLLVEAAGDTDAQILAAVDYAATYHDPVTGQGVAAVSMSWGFNEFAAQTDAAHDGHFTGHPGVTFVGASGDSGKPPIWPATSPNVLAVGGTRLTLTAANDWSSEKGWGYGGLSFLLGGSGGGISKYEAKPSYQSGVTQSSTMRTSPDVAYDADPATGVSVYDSMNGGWLTVGGTSAGAPQWAALMAIAGQGRLLAGKPPLGSADTLGAVYAMPAVNFHDITSGNNGYAAAAGYDLVTGRGTPRANLVVNYLVSTAVAAPAAPSAAPAGGGSGQTGGQLASTLSLGTPDRTPLLGLLAPVPFPTAGVWTVTAEHGRPESDGRTAAISDPNSPGAANPGPRQPSSAPADWILWVSDETSDRPWEAHGFGNPVAVPASGVEDVWRWFGEGGT
jgi:subtilase family serine protease